MDNYTKIDYIFLSTDSVSKNYLANVTSSKVQFVILMLTFLMNGSIRRLTRFEEVLKHVLFDEVRANKINLEEATLSGF